MLNIHTNLLSIGKFVDLGHLVLFNSKQCLIFEIDKPEEIFIQEVRDSKNRLYKIEKASYLSLALVNKEKTQREIGRKTWDHIPLEEATPEGTSQIVPKEGGNPTTTNDQRLSNLEIELRSGCLEECHAL